MTEVDQAVQEAKAKIAELQKLIEQLKPGISSTALTKADLQNDLTQSRPGLKALDALQGTELKKMIDDLAGKTPEGLVTDAALKEALSSYILKNQIVNNLLATVPGNVLDAMQGKALGDRISKTEQSITRLNSELEFSGIKKIIFYNNYETGWLLQATIETVDGKFFTIGFDKTTGVYAYEGKSEKQLWNIHP